MVDDDDDILWKKESIRKIWRGYNNDYNADITDEQLMEKEDKDFYNSGGNSES